MRNLNPLYEFSITVPGSIGGIAGGTAGFFTSKLIDKYFINASLDKLNKIRDIILANDSFRSTLQEVQQIDPNIANVLKQLESSPDWKLQAINILNDKIRKKKLLKIGARAIGTTGGAVLGGMIGNYFGNSDPTTEQKPAETPPQSTPTPITPPSGLAPTPPPSKPFTAEELEKYLTSKPQFGPLAQHPTQYHFGLAPTPPPSRFFTSAELEKYLGNK